MRIDESGVKHPTEADVPDMEGIFHIGRCLECQQTFPTWAGIEAQARWSDPEGYERVKARYGG